ncbi:TetR/AcrR family transcriptional regulator [Propioniciclava coleopterorum]|uniref:TetR/AcrR family transcriptional regulator n=1 Tax=Propioniciclava coleopterorum TaxID=2714937 RepID=UPI001981FAAE|nr:TetR/AcrR family transcriptional regulator [Propioniciclava coleopterorum]
MTRAKPLPRDERRRALIEATIPLLTEHGAAVSTRQVAEAAGVAEGTIFRVFASKDDLVHASIHQAMHQDDIADQLAGIPEGDLAATVTRLAGLIAAHVLRARTLIELAHEFPPPPGWGPHPGDPHDGRDTGDKSACDDDRRKSGSRAFHRRITDATTAVLARHRAELSTSPDLAASALISLTFGALHPFAGHPDLADPAAITDLLLHGIAKEA